MNIDKDFFSGKLIGDVKRQHFDILNGDNTEGDENQNEEEYVEKHQTNIPEPTKKM